VVKHEKQNGAYWLLPGGGVEPGETIPQALQRELREEACLEIAPGPPIMIVDSIWPDGGRHIINITLRAEIVSGEPRVGIDESVHEVRYMSFDELRSVTMHPDVARELIETLESGDPGLRYVRANWKEY
jgi:ADP-ribose pyrophosphatase YjhB (NUDIX family)